MSVSLAHVDYVLSDAEQQIAMGNDFAFLGSPLLNPWNLSAIVITALLAMTCIYATSKTAWLRDRVRYFRGRSRVYQDYLPLILRSSLGIALIGAGSQQALISPAVHNQPVFATVQLILGCLLITGLALTPAVLCTLCLAIFALILHTELINNLEVIMALIAILMLGQAKPGLDDLLGIPMYNSSEKIRSWVPLILRLGLGIPLVHMAITEKLLNPHLFATVINQYQLTSYLPFSTGMWVVSAIIIELALGLALLLGLQTRWISLITFLFLSLTFIFFGEEVYAHVTIFGVLFVLIITGGGNFSLDDYYAKRRQRA